jgi:hypothetical protein
MGILTRRQGDVFVITSDHPYDTSPSRRAPARMSDTYEVWTGTQWSANNADAISFASLVTADEYVRANFVKVTSLSPLAR